MLCVFSSKRIRISPLSLSTMFVLFCLQVETISNLFRDIFVLNRTISKFYNGLYSLQRKPNFKMSPVNKILNLIETWHHLRCDRKLDQVRRGSPPFDFRECRQGRGSAAWYWRKMQPYSQHHAAWWGRMSCWFFGAPSAVESNVWLKAEPDVRYLMRKCFKRWPMTKLVQRDPPRIALPRLESSDSEPEWAPS